MSHKFMKKGLRGFTLIELMVVIAIIGILATVISAPIQTYLKKSRDSKKIADIDQIRNALGQYAIDNAGLFPTDLQQLVTGNYLKVLPANALATASAKDKYMYVTYEDAVGPQAYHLGVALEFASPSLLQDQDCIGTSCYAPTASVTTTFRNAGTTFGSGNPAASNSTVATVANGAAPASDFNGNGSQEALNGVCTAVLTTCIFDVTP